MKTTNETSIAIWVHTGKRLELIDLVAKALLDSVDDIVYTVFVPPFRVVTKLTEILYAGGCWKKVETAEEKQVCRAA